MWSWWLVQGRLSEGMSMAEQKPASLGSQWSFPICRRGRIPPKLLTGEVSGDSKVPFHLRRTETAACKGRFLTPGSLHHLPLLGNSVTPGDTVDPSGLVAGAGPWRQGEGLSDPFLW